MFRVLLALLLTIVPMTRTSATNGGGGTSDSNDEWKCDGSPSDHCNPKF